MMAECKHPIITNVTVDGKHVCEECGTVVTVGAESELTLRMDHQAAITISRALRAFHDDLYSGDPAGRILRGQADYLRCVIEDSMEGTDLELKEPRLTAMLKKIAIAHHYDPGETDLDDEQPVSVSLDLGDVRMARSMIQ